MEQQVWYSFEGKYPYHGPYFYNENEFPWVEKLEMQWPLIQQELMHFLEQNQGKLVPYFNKDLSTGNKKWKAVSFIFWGFKFKKNYNACPVTMAAISKIPGLVSASISMLEPHTTIKPHNGDTNAIIRGHLGLIVPAQLPETGFQVGEEQRSWQEGKILLFNDGEWHTAWNNSSDRRYILLFDVIRPQFLDQQLKICTTVLTALTWQMTTSNISILKKVPRNIRKFLINTFLKPLVYLVLVVKNKFLH